MSQHAVNPDVIIVGAGVAGSVVATLLDRRGFRVIVLDMCHPLPYSFRAEKLSADQLARLSRLDLLNVIDRAGRTVGTVAGSSSAEIAQGTSTGQQGLFYADLVNAFRGALPPSVDFQCGKVRDISNSPTLQTVVVDEKEPLQARLVVVASGRSATLLSQLGIRKQMLSASHSMAFGFSIRASRGGRFGFQELLYRADHTASRIAFVSLFRIGDTMRVNMFTYWDAQESHCRWLIDDTHACLNEIVPELTRRTGQFEVVSRVDRCPGHLQRVEGHLQPGIVLVGDAYQTNCPATGTGITKLLNDAECLCNRHIPEWFATPGMPIEKVARYYSDPRKMAYDSESLSEAIAMRRLALDSSLRGQWRRLARGWKRSVCQWWQPSSTGAIPVGHS